MQNLKKKLYYLEVLKNTEYNLEYVAHNVAITIVFYHFQEQKIVILFLDLRNFIRRAGTIFFKPPH